MSAKIEEIRQENRAGDVSYNDIEWLCSVAEAADDLQRALGPIHQPPEAAWYLAALRRRLASLRFRLLGQPR